jgi:hypothetical protein
MLYECLIIELSLRTFDEVCFSELVGCVFAVTLDFVSFLYCCSGPLLLFVHEDLMFFGL